MARGRLRRSATYLMIAARQTVGAVTRRGRGRARLSVAGVGIATASMLLVTSVGLGLTGGAASVTTSVDYTVLPESSASSAVVQVSGPRLGQVHRVNDRLNARSDINYATPVLAEFVRVDRPGGDPVRVLLVGIVPARDRDTVIGLSVASLTRGDPYYANGTYNGTWTGEAVVSAAGGEVLNLTAGEAFPVAGARQHNRTFTVTAVEPARRAGIAQFPIAVLHLSELQRLTGATGADSADQFIVDANGPGVRPRLETLYPRSVVLEQGDLLGRARQSPSQLPLAMAVAAVTVASIVGVLFVMTTMGFEVTATARERAVLAGLGVSRASRGMLLVGRTLSITVLGGVVGVCLWLVGGLFINMVVTRVVTGVPIAVLRPSLGLFGLVVATAIGTVTLPYVLLISRRTFSLESLLE